MMLKIIVISSVFFLYSCSEKEQSLPCKFPSLQIQIKSDTGCASGSIEVTPATSISELYISELNKRGANKLNNLAAGSYRIKLSVKDGCVFDTLINIGYVQYGPLFKEVKEIMKKNCISCHGGFNPHAGLDFSNSCQIVQQSERIKQRSLMGNPTPMPPLGLISDRERDVIQKWLDAGGKSSN